MSLASVAGTTDGAVSDAAALAPSLLRNGRRTRGRLLVADPTTGNPTPQGSPLPYDAMGDAAALLPYRDHLIVCDVDSEDERRVVAPLVLQREAETGRPCHVAWPSGRPGHSYVVFNDPNLEWRQAAMRALHDGAPRTGRWGWQATRPLGSRTARDPEAAPHPHLYALTLSGMRPISLTDARARMRAVPGTRAAGRVRPKRQKPDLAVATADAPDLVAGLPDWAQVAAQMVLPPGERWWAELRVVRGATLAGYSAAQLHALLMSIPAGSRWRAEGSVHVAVERLRHARKWLAAHPEVTWAGPRPEDVVRVTGLWDRVLERAASTGLSATGWALLAQHRATSIADGHTRWLLSDRDLALGAGVARSVVWQWREALPGVEVATLGHGGADGRVATTYEVDAGEPESDTLSPYQTRPVQHVPIEELRALTDGLATITPRDLWAACPPSTPDREGGELAGERVLEAEHALVLAAVQAGLPPRVVAALTGKTDRTVRRWYSRVAGHGLVRRFGQRSVWTIDRPPAVVATEVGVVGRAEAARAEARHERAIEDARQALIAAGKFAEVGELHAAERARTARRAGRRANPSRRHGRRPGDMEVVDLYEEPALGLRVGVTGWDLAHGADALVAEWDARWTQEKAAVAREIEAWQRAHRPGAAETSAPESAGPEAPGAEVPPATAA